MDPLNHPLHEGHEVCEQEAKQRELPFFERLDAIKRIVREAEDQPEDDPSVDHEPVTL